jgi:hypothetical protein
MLNFTNLLFIIIILVLLNYIKINTNTNGESYTEITKPIINKQIKIKEFKPTYGKDQYEVNNKQIKVNFKYQDIDFLENKLELTDNINFDYDDKELMKKFYNENKTGVVATLIHPDLPHYTSPPSEQKTLYDYKFYESNNKKLEKIIKNNDIDFEDKSIKDVYNDLIVDFKKINPTKKIKDKSDKVKGAFGETSLTNIMWEYEDDTDMGFDPNQNLELAL